MPHPPPDPLEPRRGARRAVIAGLLIAGVSFMLMLSPLLLGRWSVNRYIVAFSIIGVCLGASCVLHGLWDLVRERRR